jgi:hypothetical protein
MDQMYGRNRCEGSEIDRRAGSEYGEGGDILAMTFTSMCESEK